MNPHHIGYYEIYKKSIRTFRPSPINLNLIKISEISKDLDNLIKVFGVLRDLSFKKAVDKNASYPLIENYAISNREDICKFKNIELRPTDKASHMSLYVYEEISRNILIYDHDKKSITDILCYIHMLVMQYSIPSRDPGQLRSQQSFIGGQGNIKNAWFVPPKVESMHHCMVELDEFYKNLVCHDEKQLLASLCILCYQIFVIHPFSDGNSRVIQIFIEFFLRCHGYLGDLPLLSRVAFHRWYNMLKISFLKALKEGDFHPYVRTKIWIIREAVLTTAIRYGHKVQK
jgi:hypothetical protein